MFTTREVQQDPLNKLRRKIRDLNKELTEINREMAWQSFLSILPMISFPGATFPFPVCLETQMDIHKILFDRETAVVRDINKYTAQLHAQEAVSDRTTLLDVLSAPR